MGYNVSFSKDLWIQGVGVGLVGEINHLPHDWVFPKVTLNSAGILYYKFYIDVLQVNN